MYIHEKNIFIITEPIDGNSATHGNGVTVGFSVADEATGDKWHEAGLNAGGTTCEDPPGIREGMGVKMYLAYLKDPSGNKICALKKARLISSGLTVFAAFRSSEVNIIF